MDNFGSHGTDLADCKEQNWTFYSFLKLYKRASIYGSGHSYKLEDTVQKINVGNNSAGLIDK